MTTSKKDTKDWYPGIYTCLMAANHVGHQLESLHEGLKTELVIYKTMGDHILDRPLAEIGGKGLFTKELEVHFWTEIFILQFIALRTCPQHFLRG